MNDCTICIEPLKKNNYFPEKYKRHFGCILLFTYGTTILTAYANANKARSASTLKLISTE